MKRLNPRKVEEFARKKAMEDHYGSYKPKGMENRTVPVTPYISKFHKIPYKNITSKSKKHPQVSNKRIKKDLNSYRRNTTHTSYKSLGSRTRRTSRSGSRTRKASSSGSRTRTGSGTRRKV